MERLTERFSDGKAFIKPSIASLTTGMHQVIQRLADYEDAEEQGLLLRLPCKVGDTVYLVEDNICKECIVDEFTITELNCYAGLSGTEMNYVMRSFKTANIREFGLTVFLTREEAEKALADMGCKV